MLAQNKRNTTFICSDNNEGPKITFDNVTPHLTNGASNR